MPRHINELELLASFHAVRSFAEGLNDCAVRLMLDNTTAVAYVNKSGGTRSSSLCNLAVELAGWCELRYISLEAVHLPGIFNVLADRESRRQADWSDWRLAPEVFRIIQTSWKMGVDLFASSWNAQLPRFVSWTPQPGAWRVNAMSFGWRGLDGYAFPPFPLIANCLSKMKQEGLKVILVCPFWPTQSWFPLLLEMACKPPMVFFPRPNLLMSSQRELHPLCRTASIPSIRFAVIRDHLRGEGVPEKAIDIFIYRIPRKYKCFLPVSLE